MTVTAFKMLSLGLINLMFFKINLSIFILWEYSVVGFSHSDSGSLVSGLHVKQLCETVVRGDIPRIDVWHNEERQDPERSLELRGS